MRKQVEEIKKCVATETSRLRAEKLLIKLAAEEQRRNWSSAMKEFIEYVMSFYGPNQIYGDFFDQNLTETEVKMATELRLNLKTDVPFGGDSLDRELVRDIILIMRGKKDVEYAHALKGLKVPAALARVGGIISLAVIAGFVSACSLQPAGNYAYGQIGGGQSPFTRSTSTPPISDVVAETTNLVLRFSASGLADQSASSYLVDKASGNNLSVFVGTPPVVNYQDSSHLSQVFTFAGDSAMKTQAPVSFYNNNSGLHFTLVTVFKPDTFASNQRVTGSNSAAYPNSGWYVEIGQNGEVWTVVFGQDMSVYSMSAPVSLNTYYVLVARFSDTSFSLELNGVGIGTQPLPSGDTPVAEDLVVGRSYSGVQSPYEGDLGEILIYSDVKSNASIKTISCAMALRYGITMAPGYCI